MTKSPPRKPIPSALMRPWFVTLPVARKARMPPLRPSHGRATTEAPVDTRTSVYSGTETTCAPGAA
ncbi:hypothetical protein QEG98_02530 [Myxococcus sp. MxC21-1]|nr:hypothetical protein [Myxococcus sp. MxC21-1]WNZ62719.1 hypothetical protein QEG98_02530 [Myxococcus sp. MxC21-1]